MLKEMADKLNAVFFSTEIVYRLFDQVTAYLNSLQKGKTVALALFSCVLKILLPQYFFNKKDLIVIGGE